MWPRLVPLVASVAALFFFFLLLVCLLFAHEGSALPHEDSQLWALRQHLLLAGGAHHNRLTPGQHAKRDPATPQCPNHPKAVPQAFISKDFMPERLRQAMKDIDASLWAGVQASSIRAAAAGVVYDQELVWEQGYGLVDYTNPSSPAVDSNTIFRVGSISKLITDVMLFQLRDHGKLSLDDPVSKYVPELTWPTPFVNNPGITWRTLAGQVSGLTGATPCNFFSIWEPILGDACDISNAEAWKRVTAHPPTVPMWQEPHYADGAYAVIGRALERVVGMSWEEYVTQHIFKPLGMDSTYVTYDGWSDMAKRVPPGMSGNTSLPSFVAHADLRWARPTGNVYSTVKDLGRLASLFMVGQGEERNVLGIYSSTLREMLTPSFINDERTTGYAFPFEVYHSSVFGADMPPRWLRLKLGSMPGYLGMVALVPELKTAMVLLSAGMLIPFEPLGKLLPAIEQTLWELQPLPTNPGNLTAFAGTYQASVFGGALTGLVVVQADLSNVRLNISFRLEGLGLPKAAMTHISAVWDAENDFILQAQTVGKCLNIEGGMSNVRITFALGDPTWFGGPKQVVSLSVPSDPFYGWNFVKQQQ